MTTLVLLLAVLVTFSGSFLLVWLVRNHRPQGLLYAAATLILVVNTSLLVVYHFEELVVLLATPNGAADLFLGTAVAVKTLARLVALGLLGWLAWGPPHRLARALGLPAAWGLVSLVPLPAWVGEGAFLVLAAVPTFRLWPGPLVAYFPLKLLLVLVDAGLPSGLPPFWSPTLDLGFYLALNVVLHLGVWFPRPPESRETWAGADLSPRERETAELLALQLSYKDIAARLFVSVDTVKSHARAVYRKTGCRNRDELAARGPLHP